MKAVAVFPGKSIACTSPTYRSRASTTFQTSVACSSRLLRVGWRDGWELTPASTARLGGVRLPGLPPRVVRARLEVGLNVRELRPGDHVTATVRRPATDLRSDRRIRHGPPTDTYYERGINLLHGSWTERYGEDPEYIVKVPAPEGGRGADGTVQHPGEGVEQAYEIQRRSGSGDRVRAAVVGAGSLGLLATLVLGCAAWR